MLGTTQVVLDWAPSTDNVGVVAYAIYRGGVLVGTATGSNFLDSGLNPATSYSYQVRALDSAGNQSGASTALNAKTVSISTSTTGTIGGVVFGPSGAPLANAIATITLVNGTPKSAKTNSSGVWKISNLPPAPYIASISLSGYRGSSVSITCTAGRTVLSTTTLTP